MADILGIKDGSYSADGRLKKQWDNQKSTGKFSLVYEVLTRDLNESWSTIQFDPQLPQYGQEIDGCKCCGIHVQEVKTVWENGKPRIRMEIKYDFDSELCGSGFPTGSTSQEPDEWPFEFDFSSTSFTQPLLHDALSGDPVQTPNGELIPLDTDAGAIIMHISCYSALNFWPDIWVQRLYRTNKTTFLNMGPGHVLIKEITAAPRPINGRQWFYVTYTLEMRDNNDHPFAAEVLNHGTKVREEIDGEIKTTAEVFGRNCTVNLDGDGVIYEGDEPQTLVFNKYREIEFADFLPVERLEARILWNGGTLSNSNSNNIQENSES